MAEEETKEVNENEDELEEGEEGEKKGGAKKKLIIIIAAGLLIAGGVGGFLMMGKSGGGEEEVSEEAAPQTGYYDMEEFVVNLNSTGKQVNFLKMKVTLELPNATARSLAESRMPRIRDSFQIYLRELRSEDLQGTAGLHRLKKELLFRLNKILEPETANDILFKEIIVQ